MAGPPRAKAPWRPKTSPNPGHRNTKRGIRSKQKQAERKEKRTEKRRKARQEHRNKKPWTGLKLWNWEKQYKNAAKAEKPSHKIKIGKEFKIATFNVKGIQKRGNDRK